MCINSFTDITIAAACPLGLLIPPSAMQILYAWLSQKSVLGCFLAIIIPPARKDRVVAGLVLASFAASFAFAALPVFSGLSAGTKTLILTVAISTAGALLFPVPEEKEKEAGHDA